MNIAQRPCDSISTGTALAASIIRPKAVFVSRADVDFIADSRGNPMRHKGQNGPFRQAVSVAAGRGVAGGYRGRQGRVCDGKIKAALPLVDLLWSISELRRAAGKGVVQLFRKI